MHVAQAGNGAVQMMLILLMPRAATRQRPADGRPRIPAPSPALGDGQHHVMVPNPNRDSLPDEQLLQGGKRPEANQPGRLPR